MMKQTVILSTALILISTPVFATENGNGEYNCVGEHDIYIPIATRTEIPTPIRTHNTTAKKRLTLNLESN